VKARPTWCWPPGSFGHLDIAWEDPGIALFYRTLASSCRLIVFDRRGTGISDPLPPDPLPPWESYAQELGAVLDEVGVERAALLAEVDAGPTVHDELARRVVEEFDGRLVKTTGDGILATFDGPGRAIRCAAALTDELRGIGVQIRAGLHAGEVELRDGDVGGIAVHIAARVMAAARPGDILTSGTVRDLVVGSDIAMHDRGVRPLKGVEGTWRLFSAIRPSRARSVLDGRDHHVADHPLGVAGGADVPGGGGRGGHHHDQVQVGEHLDELPTQPDGGKAGWPRSVMVHHW
jgi:pimeloyl-ACP methyl ester carboxylesterase